MNPQHQQTRKSRQNCRHSSISNRFSISPTNGPRLLSRVKVGTHSALGERSHTAAHTAKHGAFRMGPLSLPSERSTRFGNPAWPDVRTANFAAFGAWSGVLPKNAESLRNSDALMRVAVPRRRGPAGLRDLFCICRNCGLYALCSGPFRVCEVGVVSLPSARFTCCRNAGRLLVKTAHLPFFLRPLFTFAKDPAGYCQYPHLYRYPTVDCKDRTFSSHKLPNTSSYRNSRT